MLYSQHVERRTLSALSVTALGSLALGSLTTTGFAQGLITTGTVVAYEGDPAPDAAGVPLPGVTLDGISASGVFTDPQIDANGTVLFGAILSAGGQPILDNSSLAYFYGTDPSNLRLALRGNDPAPGIPNATLAAFNTPPRLSNGGDALFYASLGGGVMPATSTAFLNGPLGSTTVAVQAGDVAPGTGGGTFQVLVNGLPHGSNRNGDLWFVGALTPGSGSVDPSGSDSLGLWSGAPGALEEVLRTGTPLSGNAGLFTSDQVFPPTYPLGINDAGTVIYTALLSQTLGTQPATAADDEILAIHTPGSGSTIIAREGAPIPGLNGLTYGGGGGTLGNFFVRASEQSLLRSGEVLFLSGLGGTINPGLDSYGLLRWSNGSVDLMAQGADPAPGTNGVFSSMITALHNSAGDIALKSDSFTAALGNTRGIWSGSPGNLALVVLEGQVMPGTGGGILLLLDERGPVIPAEGAPAFHLTDSGQVIFSCAIAGGTNPGRSLWSWDEGLGLTPVLLPGDVVTLPSGQVRQVLGYEGRTPPIGTGDGAGGSVEVTGDGRIVLRVRFTDTTTAIMTVDPFSAFDAYCRGDGGNSANCGNCPCVNEAPLGSRGGCLNSFFRSAELSGSGSVRAADNNLRFEVSGASSNSFALLISGDNRLPAMGPCPVGSGLTAFDGLRCAGGFFLRHGSRAADANGDVGATTSGWGGTSPPAAGLIGSSGFTAGQTRNFQAFYRDDLNLVCQTGQNSTNAVAVTFN